MKTLNSLKRSIFAALAALSLGVALVQPVAASVVPQDTAQQTVLPIMDGKGGQETGPG